MAASIVSGVPEKGLDFFQSQGLFNDVCRTANASYRLRRYITKLPLRKLLYKARP